MLEAVAVAEADDAGAPSPPRSAFSEVLERLDDVKDRVDSGSALQLPIIDNLESIIRLLSPSSRQEAWNSFGKLSGASTGYFAQQPRTAW